MTIYKNQLTDDCNHEAIGFIVVDSVFKRARCMLCGKEWDIEEIARMLQLQPPQNKKICMN